MCLCKRAWGVLALSSEYVSYVNMPSSVTATGGRKDIFMKQPHTLAWENHQSDFRSETYVSYSLGDSPHTFICHLMGLCVPKMSAAFRWFVFFSIFKKDWLSDWQRSPFIVWRASCFNWTAVLSVFFIFKIHYPFQVKQHTHSDLVVLCFTSSFISSPHAAVSCACI